MRRKRTYSPPNPSRRKPSESEPGRRRALCPTGEGLRRAEGCRDAVQPFGLPRGPQAPRRNPVRPGPCPDRLYGTKQPDHVDVGPPFHTSDRYVLEEDRKPRPQRGAIRHALQFLPPVQEARTGSAPPRPLASRIGCGISRTSSGRWTKRPRSPARTAPTGKRNSNRPTARFGVRLTCPRAGGKIGPLRPELPLGTRRPHGMRQPFRPRRQA